MDSGGSTPSGRTSAGGLSDALPFAGVALAAPGRMAFAVAGTSFGGRLAAAIALAAASARASASALAAAAPLLSIGGPLAADFAGDLAADFAADFGLGFTMVLAPAFAPVRAAGFATGFFTPGFPLPDDFITMAALGFFAGFAVIFLRAMAIGSTSVFTATARTCVRASRSRYREFRLLLLAAERLRSRGG